MLSVFLHAPDAARIARVRELYKLATEREASRMVHESDRDRVSRSGWSRRKYIQSGTW